MKVIASSRNIRLYPNRIAKKRKNFPVEIDNIVLVGCVFLEINAFCNIILDTKDVSKKNGTMPFMAGLTRLSGARLLNIIVAANRTTETNISKYVALLFNCIELNKVACSLFSLLKCKL